jgi:predicted Zn-dependent protease
MSERQSIDEAYRLLRADRLTDAEAAIAQGGTSAFADRGREEIAHRRRFGGLPPDAATRLHIAADQEPAYLAAVDAAYDRWHDDDFANAKQLADAGLKDYPDAPGLLAIACGAELGVKHLAAADKLCAKAIAGWDDTFLAHRFAAQIALAGGKQAIAAQHLERIIAVEPKDGNAWHDLADVYRGMKDAAALKSLQDRWAKDHSGTL